MNKEAFVKRLKGIDELEKELVFAARREAIHLRAIHELMHLCERVCSSHDSHIDASIVGTSYGLSMYRETIGPRDVLREVERIRNTLYSELDHLKILQDK